MKWKVSWWIHGAGRICRGHDIVEAEKIDIDDVEELIQEDLDRDREAVTINSFAPNLPNFHKKHQELMLEARHSSISNWGLLKVKKVNQT